MWVSLNRGGNPPTFESIGQVSAHYILLIGDLCSNIILPWLIDILDAGSASNLWLGKPKCPHCWSVKFRPRLIRNISPRSDLLTATDIDGDGRADFCLVDGVDVK